MTDAIIGARYHDGVVDDEFTVVGIYERTVRGEDGSLAGTEVIVDADYTHVGGPGDLVRIELSNFKEDPEITMVGTPDYGEWAGE